MLEIILPLSISVSIFCSDVSLGSPMVFIQGKKVCLASVNIQSLLFRMPALHSVITVTWPYRYPFCHKLKERKYRKTHRNRYKSLLQLECKNIQLISNTPFVCMLPSHCCIVSAWDFCSNKPTWGFIGHR